MAFSKEMLEAKLQLEERGHICFLPEGAEEYVSGLYEKIGGTIGAKRKIEHDLIRKHYRRILDSDAVLVLNYDRKGIRNYIGGNSFLEMGIAYANEKRIFLLNDMPETELIRQEVEAMQPAVIYGDFDKICN